MKQNIKQNIARFLSRLMLLYLKIRFGKKIILGKDVIINHKFQFRGSGRLIIGDNVNMWAHEEANRFFTYDRKATIKIGNNSRLNGLTCHCAEKIDIGSDCLVGSAIIIDTDFHKFTDPDHILFGKDSTRPVKVEDGVWLCGQCVLLKGSSVGNKSVVGFRAVVTKSFPADVVIAGNPARIVKEKK